MKNAYKISGVLLLCATLSLVGCGGGGGGGGGKKKAASVTTGQVATVEVSHGLPDQNPPSELDDETPNPPQIDPSLLLSVDNQSQGTGGQGIGETAANPEPATALLGGMGLLFLATRRFRRSQ